MTGSPDDSTPPPGEDAAPDVAAAPDLAAAPPEAADGAATGAVDGPPGSPAAAVAGRFSARARWLIAGAVIAAVVGVTALAAALLGGRSTPPALGYVPADSVLLLELRPELAGDQRANLGKLLSVFPGFKDQSSLDEKISETFQLLVDRASDGGLDYRAEVEPLLDGPLYVALRDVPLTDLLSPRFLVVLTTDGTRECGEIAPDRPTSTVVHDGHELVVGTDPEGFGFACTLDGRFGLVGDEASVRDALDTMRDGGGLVETESFRAAQAALPADRLGSLVVDVGALLGLLAEADPTALPLSGLDAAALPDWLAMSVRAESDALVSELSAPIVEPGASAGGAPASGPARVSDLADVLPATTIAAFEAHDLGAGIVAGLDAVRADPGTADEIRQFEAAAALFGGIDGLTGWIGDTAVAVTLDKGTPTAGIVVRATDAAAARSMLDSIRNIVLLAGGASGLGLEEVDHDGTTITLLDIGDWSELLGPTGGSGANPGLEGRAVIAWAIRDDLVVAGVGESFVVSVLDSGAGDSLADSERYRRALALAGPENDGQGYVDLAAIIAFVGDGLEGDEAREWEADIAPWVEPLDGLAFATGRDEGLTRSRIVMTVR